MLTKKIIQKSRQTQLLKILSNEKLKDENVKILNVGIHQTIIFEIQIRALF
jgi:hypothetical protein